MKATRLALGKTRQTLRVGAVTCALIASGALLQTPAFAAPNPACTGTAPSAPVILSADEAVPGQTVLVNVAPVACDGNAPLKWLYFSDAFGNSLQHCYVDASRTCPAFTYHYDTLGGRPTAPSLNIIYVYAVNSNGLHSQTTASEPFPTLSPPPVCQYYCQP